MAEPQPIFFASPAELRDWLDANHETATELWVGYHKKHTGRPSVTWSEVVDEALCVGWIDGLLRRIDEDRHMQRLTPRRKGSNWSAINVEKIAALTAEGRMRPAGVGAWEQRREDRTAIYSYEQGPAEFTPEQRAELERHPSALADFESRAPSYRRAVTSWIVSAKQPQTRERRLTRMIEDHGAGHQVKQFTRPGS